MRFAAGAALVLGAWTGILAGLALALPPGAPLAVFAPGHAMETVARAEGSFIDARIVMSCRSLVSIAKT